MGDEIRKLFLTIGMQHLLLIVDLLSCYTSAFDIRDSVWGDYGIEPALCIASLIVAIYDFLTFFFYRRYVLRFPAVNVGRIQRLRSAFFPTLFKSLLVTVSALSLGYALLLFPAAAQIGGMLPAVGKRANVLRAVATLALLVFFRRISLKLLKLCLRAPVRLDQPGEAVSGLRLQSGSFAQMVRFYCFHHILRELRLRDDSAFSSGVRIFLVQQIG